MKFSWKRGLLHAAIPFGVVLLGGAALIAANQVADEDRFAEGMGRFLVFVLLLGLGISYLAQTGRRRAAFGVTLGLIALLGALGALALAPRSHPLTAADRAPLIAFDDHGQARLRHPTFPFSILAPGPDFAPSAEITRTMREGTAADHQTVYYGYSNPPTSASQAILIVAVFDDAGGSRGDFQQLVDGVTTQTRRQFPPGEATFPQNDVVWTDTQHELHFHAVIGAAHFLVNAFAAHPADRRPFVVALMVMAADANALASVLTSFRLDR